MSRPVVLLSVPALRASDLQQMPKLLSHLKKGERAILEPSFPCVTWPVEAHMLTGKLAESHGVIGNGFFWREEQQVEMWTAWNERITAPQIWDRLHDLNPKLTSAVWFPMLSKGCGADYICMPAPIHNPDGTEDLWCYTKPVEYYGELRARLGDFPLQHFWGPLANIKATQWITDSAVVAAENFRPDFFYLYIPHLDYAAQKEGPNSNSAVMALAELDEVLDRLVVGFRKAYGDVEPLWIVASEYAIVPVDHVVYPNRVLRNAGLLEVDEREDGELIALEQSKAWALCDHQFSHIFVRDADLEVVQRIVEAFTGTLGIDEVLFGEQRAKYGMNHERSGEVILISSPNSWQAYYWWLDDAYAPSFARKVDIHRKPGYDPVELHLDRATRGTPLDATLVRGSHGAPAKQKEQLGVLLSSQTGTLAQEHYQDTDVFGLVLQQFEADQ